MSNRILLIMISSFLLFCSNSKADKNSHNSEQETYSFDDYKIFKVVKCKDHDGFGIEAFRMMIPEGWEISYFLNWDLSLPVELIPGIDIVAENQNDGTNFHVYPKFKFTWYLDPNFQQLNQGMQYPQYPENFITETIFPFFIPGAIDVNIEYINELENFKHQSLVAWVETCNSSGLWRAQINRNNTATFQDLTSDMIYTGEIYAKEISFTYCLKRKDLNTVFIVSFYYMWPENTYNSYLNMDIGIIHWGTKGMISFTAPEGEIDDFQETFNVIYNSFRFNQNWINSVHQLREGIFSQRWANLRAALNAISSQTRTTEPDYSSLSQAEDRIFENWSEYLLDTENYYDPITEETYELPESYYAWSNGSEYILTDERNFDPNLISNLNNLDWKQMRAR